MLTKILYLLGFFGIAILGAFGATTNLIILTDATILANSPREKWQLITFAILFLGIMLFGLILFFARLHRLLVDIRINKENK